MKKNISKILKNTQKHYVLAGIEDKLNETSSEEEKFEMPVKKLKTKSNPVRSEGHSSVTILDRMIPLDGIS